MSTPTKPAKARKPRANSGLKRVPQDAHGLWIDRELLRRHMNPLPKFVLDDKPMEQHDVTRYLELADTLLGTKDNHENTG